MKVRGGMLLLEMVVAIGVAMIALLAIVQIGTRSIQNSGISARSTQAYQLAGEGMGFIKNQRETLGWMGFQAKTGASVYCLAVLEVWVTGGCGTIVGTTFTRTAVLTVLSAANPKRVSAVVTVTWQEAGKVYSTLQTYEFTNYF